jgi:hypothetical protein
MLNFTLFIIHESDLVIHFLLEIDLINLITNLSKASIDTFS